MFSTADVYAFIFFLIILLTTIPASLVLLNLFLPNVTERTAIRIQKSPFKSFTLGLPGTLAAFIAFITITRSAGPLQLLAFLFLLTIMAIGTIGGAGMARFLGLKLSTITTNHSDLQNLIRGAITYELACLTPLVGWFVITPLLATTVLGAAAFGILGFVPAHWQLNTTPHNHDITETPLPS
ncbi:MAG TPA: hypothetical protein VLL52_01965 [Anaerolineae bacterium]|nr:hypothetical protein [Anaerolineae bacterium]